MALQAIAFYLLAAVTIAAGFGVVSARNPVHSVLFLILAFFSAAGLFVLMGAEFLAMLLVVVYVGAVAVLFLFVVMMLDVDFAALRQGFARSMPLGALVAGILAFEMVAISAVVANRGAAAGSTGPCGRRSPRSGASPGRCLAARRRPRWRRSPRTTIRPSAMSWRRRWTAWAARAS